MVEVQNILKARTDEEATLVRAYCIMAQRIVGMVPVKAISLDVIRMVWGLHDWDEMTATRKTKFSEVSRLLARHEILKKERVPGKGLTYHLGMGPRFEEALEFLKDNPDWGMDGTDELRRESKLYDIFEIAEEQMVKGIIFDETRPMSPTDLNNIRNLEGAAILVALNGFPKRPSNTSHAAELDEVIANLYKEDQ